MTAHLVKDWFQEDFSQLNPQLQNLHQTGGILSGLVTLTYGRGLAGFMGRHLAKKLGLPAAGQHSLSVEIRPGNEGLKWDRTFNTDQVMKSLFVPVGTRTNGYWLETTGDITLQLTVDIVEGGWHWRCQKMTLRGIPLPLWLLPKTTAYKSIEQGRYRFFVGFSLPVIGPLLSYSGLLDLKPADES
ncbi:DUF4166 domain-containing protein [Rhodovibrionaceae bacterium A322]